MTRAEAEAEASNGAAVNRGLRRYAEARERGASAVRKALGDAEPDYCLTDFLYRIAIKDEATLKATYGAARTKTSLSATGGGSTGGYLVPTELRLDLMRDVGEESIFRPRATVVPMTTGTLELPLPDATTARSAGVAPFFGGLQMSWTGEAQTRQETEPSFRALTLRAWELSGYALQSNPHFIDSGPGVEAFLRRVFARSIAWYEDYAYFRGDGVGKPQGIVGAAGTKQVSRQTGNQFTQQDLFNMTEALLPASWPRACWAIHPLLWEWVVKLGSTQFQVNMPREPGGAHFSLNGLPGYVTEKLPALGTQGDVVLFDPELYVIGDRGAVEIVASEHEPTAYLKNQLAWRVVYRGDGQPWFNATITLPDASTTVSPHVVLV